MFQDLAHLEPPGDHPGIDPEPREPVGRGELPEGEGAAHVEAPHGHNLHVPRLRPDRSGERRRQCRAAWKYSTFATHF